jgi:dethiobiotin synthetase
LNPLLFITGTDTGVGKTVLATLLLAHLRRQGIRACAMKPFCSGSRTDLESFRRAQGNTFTDLEMNPYYFPQPVAPLVGARMAGRRISLPSVIAQIQSARACCDFLLVEGCGGLLVPLTARNTLADLIGALGCATVVVAPNRVGVINHSSLTVGYLAGLALPSVGVVLMGCRESDFSSRTNGRILAEVLSPISVVELPFLGVKPLSRNKLGESIKKLKKSLARVLDSANFSLRSSRACGVLTKENI